MKTKKFIWSVLAMALAVTLSVGFASCGDDDEADEVTVYPSSVTFTEKGGSQQVTIKSNTKWTITGMVEGITISPMQGNGDGVITVIASEIPSSSTSSRSGSYHISAGNASANIMVTQTKNVTLADRVAGVYSGRLKLGEEVIEDAYIVKVAKQTPTTVSVEAPFFGGETINFNLVENGNQIQFTNSTLQNFNMTAMGNQVTISYLSSGGNMLTYTGTK